MVKSHAGRGKLLTSNLPQLQNLIKVNSVTLSDRIQLTSQRDPKGYKEEFLTQYNHYLSLLRLNSVASAGTASSSTGAEKDKSNELFGDLVTFISQVAQCYPEETKDFPTQLKGLLLGQNGSTMVKGDLRKTAVKNLVMLRNKEVIDSIE